MKIFAPFWNKRKGFTIVELVIVIAVIAILAAVLIPTFSSLIKKANLSADKQAVREMNLALAADEELHGKATTLERAMKVLADAGYNSKNWQCLTTGYEVYWWEDENRLVLYNASSAEVEYPTDVTLKDITNPKYGGKFKKYNNNVETAIKTDVSLGSNSAGSPFSTITSDAAVSSSTAQSAVNAVESTLGSNSGVRSALGLKSNSAFVYGAKEISDSFGAGDKAVTASMTIMSVGDQADAGAAHMLKSNGEVKENVFYIQVSAPEGASAADIASAQKAAGNYVYTIFNQMNTNQVSSSGTAVLLAPDTVIDASGKEWVAPRYFGGLENQESNDGSYFGTVESSKPVTVKGVELTSATAYTETMMMEGSNSKYFVTGVFANVFGDTTIENVTFSNVRLDQPAMDYNLAGVKVGGKDAKNRNTIGIIGAISNGDQALNVEANVVLRNITIDSTCEFICGADGGCLVGYVGSFTGSGADLRGTVTIDNCHVSGKIVSRYAPGAYDNAYAPVGGMVGFSCRCTGGVTVTVKDCTFDGTVDGCRYLGAFAGDWQNGNLIFQGVNHFENATINAKGYSTSPKIGGVCGNCGAATLEMSSSTVKAVSELPAYTKGSDKFNTDKVKI